MDTEASLTRHEFLTLTSEIVSAYASNASVEMAAVPDMIGSVLAKLRELAAGEEAVPEARTPAVPIRRSVTNDHIVCLEDGKKLKMLKRHLMVAHGLTPDDYRAKWGLKHDYPMIAPVYEAKRQEIAKKIGLGRKPRIIDPAPAPDPVPSTPPKKRSRSKSAA
ncbi:MucR family transcriptional regulator [Amaricoccus sp. HAR-UPW-R2A-40]|nr:MucR family transcriptional regulator [Amaricoccus sp. HAR-UPW-R2A-40]